VISYLIEDKRTSEINPKFKSLLYLWDDYIGSKGVDINLYLALFLQDLSYATSEKCEKNEFEFLHETYVIDRSEGRIGKPLELILGSILQLVDHIRLRTRMVILQRHREHPN